MEKIVRMCCVLRDSIESAKYLKRDANRLTAAGSGWICRPLGGWGIRQSEKQIPVRLRSGRALHCAASACSAGASGFRKNCQLETGGFVAGASLMIRTGVWLKAAALGLFCLGFFFSRLRASLFPMPTACHRSIDIARAYGIQAAMLPMTEP
jgi:hypothetical protein